MREVESGVRDAHSHPRHSLGDLPGIRCVDAQQIPHQARIAHRRIAVVADPSPLPPPATRPDQPSFGSFCP